MRVVVVGAGFAGLGAARALAAHQEIQVTLVDRRNHHLFQALLYQVATAGLNPSEIASPVRAIFRGQSNVRVLMAELTGLDLTGRRVELDQGRMQLEYDALILAIGGQTCYFGHPQWERYAPGLKSIEEALALRSRVLRAFEEAEKSPDDACRAHLTSIAVIGGGPTGVELSGAFAELRRHVLRWDFRALDPRMARVYLVEGGPRVLAAFPEELSLAAQRDLGALGVELVLGEPVEEVGPGFLRTSKRRLEAHTMVWAAGVSGHPLAATLGLPLGAGGRVRVEPDLSLPGYPEVFCLGDMVEFPGANGRPLPGMAPVAMQQGAHGAANVWRYLRGQPRQDFVYLDPGIMATVGRTRGVAFKDGRAYTGARGWFTWLWHHLLRIVDYENRVLVGLRWAWAYVAWKWGARLIHGAADPPGAKEDGHKAPDP